MNTILSEIILLPGTTDALLKEHFRYLSMGDFPLSLDRNAFDEEEIRIITKYGYWFRALVSENLSPVTSGQIQFIKVVQNKLKPETTYERVWRKYQFRLDYENETHGRYSGEKIVEVEAGFQTRNGHEKMRKMKLG